MTSYPDPLFREGLEHYRKPAPASAWERIESGLDKKKHKSPWLKIAAGLVLLLATSVLLWKFTQTDTTVATALKKSAPVTLNPDTIASFETEESKDKIRESSDVSREDHAANDIKPSQSVSIVERSRNNHSDTVHSNPPVVERSRNEPSGSRGYGAEGRGQFEKPMEEVQVVVVDVPDAKTKEEPTTKAQVEITNEITANEMVSAPDRTNITYTAEEVNEKFLKKEITPEATPAKKNTSGFQKVVAVALDLKYEDALVGALREKKNEWLSINTSPKRRESNK